MFTFTCVYTLYLWILQSDTSTILIHMIPVSVRVAQKIFAPLYIIYDRPLIQVSDLYDFLSSLSSLTIIHQSTILRTYVSDGPVTGEYPAEEFGVTGGGLLASIT